MSQPDKPAAHTAGPWLCQKRKDGGYRIYGGRNAVQSLAVVETWTIEEDDANARLIAAAPELLKACKRAEHALWDFGAEHRTDPLYGALVDLRAALARAEAV